LVSMSSPTFCLSMSSSKMIPVPALKHSLIIHRRGMRARLWRCPFGTDPPPTSESVPVSNEPIVRGELGRTTVGANEEYLFDVGLLPGVHRGPTHGGSAKWHCSSQRLQAFRNQSDRLHGVPARRCEAGNRSIGRTKYHTPRDLIFTSEHLASLSSRLNSSSFAHTLYARRNCLRSPDSWRSPTF
jgi:hypothetical protein